MSKQRQNLFTHLGSCNRVSVSREHNGRCYTKRCKKIKVFDVFIDDGQPKLSRFFGSYCRKHLFTAVNKGWDTNDDMWKKLSHKRRK